jgi:poly(3-hydroxybutyrate) depolymerase
VKAAAAAAGPVRKDRRDVGFDKQSIWKNTSVAHILYRGRVKRIILPFCFLIISGLAALSQPVQAGPQAVPFQSEIDGTDQPYALYAPQDCTSARARPVVISLHGAWSNHRLNSTRTRLYL